MVTVSSTPLLNQNGANVIDASGVVPVSASRFVFIVNSESAELFELNLNADGSQRGPVVPRPIVGLTTGALSDPEGIARIDVDGEIDLIVVSSLSATGFGPSVNNGLVRIRYASQGALHAEAMPGFREWLLDSYPDLKEAADLVPDQQGLNLEGLAWDPSRRALLFGVRSPVNDGRIPVLCVELDTAAPWTTAALRAGPTLFIEKMDFAVPQGVRAISYDAVGQEFLVILGRSTTGDAPFELCTWDGTGSTVTVLDVTFEPPASSDLAMKPEGVAAFPGNGARRFLIVDDAGGFVVIDEP